jgi:hypothetical protein
MTDTPKYEVFVKIFFSQKIEEINEEIRRLQDDGWRIAGDVQLKKGEVFMYQFDGLIPFKRVIK